MRTAVALRADMGMGRVSSVKRHAEFVVFPRASVDDDLNQAHPEASPAVKNLLLPIRAMFAIFAKFITFITFNTFSTFAIFATFELSRAGSGCRRK